MSDAILIIGLVALAGALVTGVLGFLILPAQSRPRKGVRTPHARHPRRPSARQGFARALFILFAAGAFVTFFFWLVLPG